MRCKDLIGCFYAAVRHLEETVTTEGSKSDTNSMCMVCVCVCMYVFRCVYSMCMVYDVYMVCVYGVWVCLVCACVTHRKVKAYRLVLPVDLVCDVIEEPSNGGLLQGHGRGETTAHQSRPHLPDTVPVSPTGQTHPPVHPQQTVQRALEKHSVTPGHSHVCVCVWCVCVCVCMCIVYVCVCMCIVNVCECMCIVYVCVCMCICMSVAAAGLSKRGSSFSAYILKMFHLFG